VEEVRSVFHLGALACAFVIVASPSLMFACQATCVMLATSAKHALLEDRDGNPLSNAEVIVRDASKNADGSECFCGRFGPMISHLWTDVRGRLDLRELRPGEYWITYMNQQDGESFYVSIEKGKKPRSPLELRIDQLDGRCYLIDVERNETKPNTGWPKPLSKLNAQTH
jgi:hypothetical protein